MNRQAITSSVDPSDPENTIYAYRATYDASFPGGRYEGVHAGATDADATWGPVKYAGGTFIPAFGPPMTYAVRNADGAVGGNPAYTPFLDGPTVPPEPGETGWKDTIKAYPGTVTRIVARWAPQDVTVGHTSAGRNSFPFDPTTGPGYVWHCHILDHEDNEMMRPLKIA